MSGCHSVPLLARYVSGPCEALVHRSHSKVQTKTHRSICNSLVLNPPGEPFERSGACIEFILWGFRNCRRDHGALVRQCMKHYRISWSSKKHKGPSFVVGLGTRWRTGYGINHLYEVILTAYTTRCVFDLRIPPLKTAIASPILQMAWPWIGYMSCIVGIHR
jgi:hypothetical protein